MRFYYKPNLIIKTTRNNQALFSSWQNEVKQVCLSGGRGKGKTVELQLYLLSLVRRVPGIDIIVGRTNYGDLADTFIKTLEERIFKYPLGDSNHRHPLNPFVLSGGVDRPKRMRFDNGSSIRFIGLNDPRHRRGMECSIFVLNEGTTEDTSEVWGAMGGTTAGGRGATWKVEGQPYNQLITDCNPDSPYHWIYKHFRGENPTDPDNGIYQFDNRLWLGYTHQDNPALVDDFGALNRQGQQTIEDLLAFYPPGFEQQRMIWGEWVAAKGMVYSMWKPEIHEVPMQMGDFSSGSRWIAGIDYGGTSPFAFTLINFENSTYRTFKEFGMSDVTIDEVIAKIDGTLNDIGLPKTRLSKIFPDTNVPGFTKALRQAGYPIQESDKDIEPGVDFLKQKIKNNQFFVNTNSLDDRDQNYSGPQGWKEEVLGYKYLPEEEQEKAAKPNLPVPVKNHWMDAHRYPVYGTKGGTGRKERTPYKSRFNN